MDYSCRVVTVKFCALFIVSFIFGECTEENCDSKNMVIRDRGMPVCNRRENNVRYQESWDCVYALSPSVTYSQSYSGVEDERETQCEQQQEEVFLRVFPSIPVKQNM